MVARLSRALVVVLALCAAAPQARAATDGDIRIALAIRQAAMIEAITGAACFAMGGIDVQRQSGLALERLDHYGTVLVAFREGHRYLRLSPLPGTADDSTLLWAQGVWDSYEPALRQIVAGDLHTVVMSQVITGKDETVLTAVAVASEFVKAYGDAVMDPASYPAMRKVGHLQMLTQRAIREACFVAFDLGGPAVKTALAATLAEIATTVEQLGSTDAQDTPLPNGRIARNLKTAALFWSKVEPTIKAMGSGTAPDPDSIAKMLKMNASVLKQLNQAVEGFF